MHARAHGSVGKCKPHSWLLKFDVYFFPGTLFSVSKVYLFILPNSPGASNFNCEGGLCTGSWPCALWKPLSDHTDDPGSNPGKAIPGAEVSDHMVLTE